jgi:hypothetical protein
MMTIVIAMTLTLRGAMIIPTVALRAMCIEADRRLG